MTVIGIYWLRLLLSGLATIHVLPLWVTLTELLKSLVHRSMELTLFQINFPGLAHHSLKNNFTIALEQMACYRGERGRNKQLQQQLLKLVLLLNPSCETNESTTLVKSSNTVCKIKINPLVFAFILLLWPQPAGKCDLNYCNSWKIRWYTMISILESSILTWMLINPWHH